jgi:hypothetical protein
MATTRWSDITPAGYSRGLAAYGRECRPERTVADIEILAVRARAAAAGLRQRGVLAADGCDCAVCGRCTRAGGTRAGGCCGEQERSADRDRDLVRHLFSSLQAACWRRAGVRTDGGNGYTRAYTFPHQCADAPRLSRPSRIGISKTSSCCALMGANPTQSTDRNHAQFTTNSFCGALSVEPPGSSRILDCSPLLPTGCPPNLAGNRVGQRRSAISHSCRRGGAG